MKDPSRDVWFRVSTRFRAGGYWIREKAQAVRHLLARALAPLGDAWADSSRGGKIGISVAAGLLALLLLIRFAPLPGVPCEISAAKECAPPDEAIALVPADALLYGHLSIDSDTAQYEQAREAFEQLSDLRTILAAEIPAALATPSGAQIDIARDVLPWAKRDLSVALLPGPSQTSLPVFVAGVADKQGAEQFLSSIAPQGTQPQSQQQGDASLSVYPGGFAAAYVSDALVFGNETAVRRSLDAGAGDAPALEQAAQAAPRDALPDARFAEVFLSRQGVQQLLVGRTGISTQIETFIDYGATSGVAAGLIAHDDGIELNMISELDSELVKTSPSFFAELPRFEPGLVDHAGGRAIGYAGVGEVGPTLAELLKNAGGAGSGLSTAVQTLSANLGRESGVDPLKDLLPALGGQAALIAEPTDGVPFASLVVDDVDEDKAKEALARLQGPLLRSLNQGAGGRRLPRFEEKDVDGVKVNSVQISATVNLSYALFDERLVVSTDPAGIEQVRDASDTLAGSEGFNMSSQRLPDRVSTLVFFNLNELFGQITRTDLVEDPFFANLSVLFENASSVGLGVDGDQDRIRSELFLALD
ncbi:MAG: DUF3352 domain-containing protein [Actinomycetota bacterium]|nr:DUF3352 domain-containing protein [Actinomycetota bacterium]